MSTLPGSENLPEAVPAESVPAPSGGLVRKHWRGDYSLPRSYWVNGGLIFGFCINLVFVTAMMIGMRLLEKRPALVVVVGIGEIALLVAAYVWAVTGIWRSAGKYKGRRLWPVLARIIMCAGVLVSIKNVSMTIRTVIQISRSQSAEGLEFHR